MMNDSINSAEALRKTFWNLICDEKYTISIPRIQRDYAQGREEVEPSQIRRSFLNDIFGALIDEKPLDVNFIYGNLSVDGNESIFVPIDGQQRLTTLFLLHWYFAMWSGKKDENKEVLKRFQYDTRFVAGSFCENLVDDVNIDLKSIVDTDSSIVDVIKDYYWFFSSYERDATIRAMLVMLKSIHAMVCELSDKSIVDSFFDKLTGPNCPISFLFLDIKDVGLTDEIYIKMNARGKALTRFENFKAQLSGYLSDKDEEFSKEFIGNINGYWSAFFWHKEYRPDVLVQERRNQLVKSKIFDDQIMNLFRFMMFNEYMTRVDMTDDSSDLKYLARRVLNSLNKETDFEFVSHLFSDEFRTVAGHTTTKANVDIDSFRLINVLLNVLSRKKETTGDICFLEKSLYEKEYIDEEVFFKRLIRAIPEKALNMEEQLILYAEYIFLIKYSNSDYSFDKTIELTNWIRFIYNITHNMTYNTIDDYLRTVQRIRKIIDDNNAEDILQYAAVTLHKSYATNSGYGFSELAMKEECIKAHLIKRNSEWRSSLINAENSFLDSQVSALLSFSGIWQQYEIQMDEYEKTYIDDEKLSSINAIMQDVVISDGILERFNTYLNKLNMIFDKNGLKPEMEEDSILRRALLTFGGEDSYMLPAGKPVRCFLDASDRDNSFKRLFRDDNKKNKNDTVGVRIYFKYLLDSIEENQPLKPQLQSIVDGMTYDENSKWKKYFIEMPEILDSLYKKNGTTADNAIFLNPKRYICVSNPDQVLLLEKMMTSSKNREYYSYVLYLKAIKNGITMSYHKDFGEESKKYAIYVDSNNKTTKISYEYDDAADMYMFIARDENGLAYMSDSIEEMLVFLQGLATNENA